MQQGTLIDIKVTVDEHQAILPSLLAGYALSGCDTAPMYFGVVKAAVLKNVMAKPDSLTKLGCLNVAVSEVIGNDVNFSLRY